MNTIQIAELLDDVALERTILDAALEARHVSEPGTIDLRGSTVIVGMLAVSSLSGQALDDFVQKIMMPILFGSAWKIVDIVVERSWQAVGGPPRPTIAAKCSYAQRAAITDLAALLGNDADLAGRIASLYRETLELRHAITHRRTIVGPHGEVSGASGLALLPNELDAFCRLALRVVDCIASGLTDRLRSEIAWWLNLLQRVHGLGPLPDAYAPRPADIVLVNAWSEGHDWFVDTERAHARARSINSGFPYAQLRIHAPNGEFATVEVPLETAPNSKRARFDPRSEPRWP